MADDRKLADDRKRSDDGNACCLGVSNHVEGGNAREIFPTVELQHKDDLRQSFVSERTLLQSPDNRSVDCSGVSNHLEVGNACDIFPRVELQHEDDLRQSFV